MFRMLRHVVYVVSLVPGVVLALPSKDRSGLSINDKIVEAKMKKPAGTLVFEEPPSYLRGAVFLVMTADGKYYEFSPLRHKIVPRVKAAPVLPEIIEVEPELTFGKCFKSIF